MPDRQKIRYEVAKAVAQAESEDAALELAARRLFPELGSDFTSFEMRELIIGHCALRHQLRADQVRLMPKGRLAELLAADIEMASSQSEGSSEPLTGLMTITNIAEMFGISRPGVDEILTKYQHVKVGRKYRMRVEDGPPRHKKLFGASQASAVGPA